MIADPPLLAGALHVNETCVLPAVPATEVGALGTVRGVTEPDAVETVPVPAVFVALTRNVYAVPFTKPVTVAEAVVAVVESDPLDKTSEDFLGRGFLHWLHLCRLCWRHSQGISKDPDQTPRRAERA